MEETPDYIVQYALFSLVDRPVGVQRDLATTVFAPKIKSVKCFGNSVEQLNLTNKHQKQPAALGVLDMGNASSLCIVETTILTAFSDI